jgi:hypothetical protein
MKASEFAPLTIPQPFASNGDITEIADTSTTIPNFSTGVPEIFSTPYSAGGSYFQRSMMNAIGNMASKNAFYRQCGGFYCFDQTVCDKIGGYPKGCVLHWLSNGQYLSVQSLVDDNTYDFVTNGVDGVNWALCNTGEGMLFPNFAIGTTSTLFTYAPSGSWPENLAIVSNQLVMPFDGYIMLHGWVAPDFGYVERVINETSVINAATLLACQAIIDICISSPQGTQTIADDVSVTIPTVDMEKVKIWSPGLNNCALFEYGYGLNRAPTGFGLIPVKKGSKILMLAGQTFYQYTVDGKACTCEKGSASIVAYPAI